MSSKAKAVASTLKAKTPGNKTPPEKSHQALMAELAVSASLTGAIVVEKFSKHTVGEVSLEATAQALALKMGATQKGNLSHAEATLTAQAEALNAMFTELSRRAALNMGEYLDATESYLRLALKAQAQCRSTLQALAEMKHPPHVAWVKQTNIAHQQQINTGAAPTKMAQESLENPEQC